MTKKRINGRNLGQNIGEEVILLGTINRVRYLQILRQ